MDEHLSCPQCGYDLFGIPELRCPECGFRFDRAALKDLAASADWQRWAVARVVITRTAWALPLVLAGAASGSLLSPPVATGLSVWAYVAAFIVWVALTGGWHPYHSPTILPAIFFGGLFLLGTVLFAFPPLAAYLAIFPLGSAVVTRLREWPMLAPEANITDVALRRSVSRFSTAADIVLSGATMLWLIVLVV